MKVLFTVGLISVSVFGLVFSNPAFATVNEITSSNKVILNNSEEKDKPQDFDLDENSTVECSMTGKPDECVDSQGVKYQMPYNGNVIYVHSSDIKDVLFRDNIAIIEYQDGVVVHCWIGNSDRIKLVDKEILRPSILIGNPRI